ncbi:hypothetical protein JQC67_13090 [Aurantibacter crassamenti]|nr:hypothetical protein [Aurantibacter crassamenti]
MENTSRIRPPVWFWVISVIALLWNLMGVFAYLADAYISVEDLTAMTQAQRELHESRPAWVTAAYAIAVWGGVLGCILLLLRKKIARPIILISLLGVIAQQVYIAFLSNTFEIYGSEALWLPIVILIFAVALVIFAKLAHSKNWLT